MEATGKNDSFEKGITLSFGSIVRHQREKLHLTQDQTAAKIGISKPYLSNIETDKVRNPPTDKVLKALERVLDFEGGQLQRLAHLARTPMDIRQEHELLEAKVHKLRSVLKNLLADDIVKDRIAQDDLSDLTGKDTNISADDLIASGVAVPVINKIAAGYPPRFQDMDFPAAAAQEYLRCPDVHDPQAFAVRVFGDAMEPDYRQGDVIIFSPNTSPVSGDDCFVRFAEEGGTTFKRFYEDSAGMIRLQPLNSKYPADSYQQEKITGLWPAIARFERLRRG